MTEDYIHHLEVELLRAWTVIYMAKDNLTRNEAASLAEEFLEQLALQVVDGQKH